MGTQDDMVMVIEDTIMEDTHKDPKFMASLNIAATHASVDNIDWLMEDVERNKERMFKLKDSVVKLWGEGIYLKRKYEAIISKKALLLGDYKALET